MEGMCKLDSRFHESTDIAEIKGKIETVKLSSLLTASDQMRAKNFSVLLVEVPQEDGSDKLFRATPNSQVPMNTQLIRSEQGAIVGIPAVAGG